MGVHGGHFAAPRPDKFDDFSRAFRGSVHRQQLEGLLLDSIDGLVYDVWLRNGHFVSLAPHVFDEHRDMQHPASADLEGVAIDLLDAQGDIAERFPEEAFAEMASADEFPFLSVERGVVDAEHHGYRWLVYVYRRELLRGFLVRYCVADVDILDTYHRE